ncbi:MAG: glycosyltransferase family 4 protein [Candidatus Peribacteraceae bacterium]|nr:glycosyltransferase family 4 protein [Candidatus Peribacteraceae bacterium]
MHIILATGIYPPDIGGPATYSYQLAKELSAMGHRVIVLTYAQKKDKLHEEGWTVIKVALGLPILRWFAYAKQLKKHAKNADVLYAFSSVSCGVPIMIAKLKKPKKVLRLGGDFLWERATDNGSLLTLKEWYTCEESFRLPHFLMERLLKTFNTIVFSTAFQQRLYRQFYNELPTVSVIENALTTAKPVLHARHESLKLLFMGRFVRFKNLPVLLQAMHKLPHVHLTLIGDGPEADTLHSLIQSLHLTSRVHIHPPVHGQKKIAAFADHDALILPSLTEISPNTALEARAHGLPILLTRETGLSPALSAGMHVVKLLSVDDIIDGIRTIETKYESIATAAALSLVERSWRTVASDHVSLFESL